MAVATWAFATSATPRAEPQATARPAESARPNAAPRASVPVRVGKRSLDATALASRWSSFSSGELAGKGRAVADERLAWVRERIVPELLYEQEAERRDLAQTPGFYARERDILYRALVEREAAELSPPTDEAIERFYQAHESDFVRPFRIRLWRILVASEARAAEIIDRARKEGPTAWREMSRKWSVDKATRQRGGDLGFVHADGSTDVPQLRVDKALFAAAEDVADGQLVDEPVREGTRFAAVWRRGSLAESEIAVEQARPTIEALLLERARRKKIDALVAKLTEDHVSKRRDDLLKRVNVPAFPSPGD